MAACIVYLIGGLCLLATIPFFGFPPSRRGGQAADHTVVGDVGGICNAVFLLSTLPVTQRLGSATFTTVVVVTALVLDNYGLMGFEVRPATAGRLVSGGLAIAGVIWNALL